MVKEVDSLNSIDLSNPDYIVPRFNTLHHLAKEQIRYNDKSSAKESYTRMLALYSQINQSDIHANEKQMAYGKLMYIFTSLSNEDAYEPIQGFMPIAKFLFPISMVVLVLLIIFFIRPEFSMTGMAVADVNTAPYWNGGDAVFKVKGETTVNLDVYFADNEGDDLIYSSSYLPDVEIIFEGSIMKIKPNTFVKGTRSIAIVAHDGKVSERFMQLLK